MGFALYFDVNVPALIGEGLRARGVDVLTSQADGTRTMQDESLLLRAAQLDRLLVSLDHDFLRIGANWQATGRPFPGILFLRGEASLANSIEDIELIVSCCNEAELRNLILYVPLA